MVGCDLANTVIHKHTNSLIILVHGDKCKGSTRYWNYLEDYWPCAGGLSAVSAIDTQLRDLINISSGLTR